MEKIIPIYLRIERDIRDKIKKGKYKIGDKLPGEEEISSYFRVSRMTVRKSLSILASEGYIYRIPGKGTFITSPEDKEIEILKSRQREMKKMNKGIGVLVPSITLSLFAGIARGAEDFLRENNYHVLLGNYDDNSQKEKEYIETFIERGVSGFIVSPSYFSSRSEIYNTTLIKKGISFVFTDIAIKGIETDMVATDNIKGGYIGTKHLMSLGCKSIAFISGHLFIYSSEGRYKGYQKALMEENISIREEIVKDGDISEKFGYKATKELFSKNKIDGIFSANEPITIGVLKAIKELNITPDDVKIVSFDEPKIPTFLSFPLTLIKQPRYEIGKIAAQTLLERIKEKRKNIKVAPFKKILLEPKIEKEEGLIIS